MLPCRNLYAVPDTFLLHRWFTLRRARHSSAAQLVSLEFTDGTCESIYLVAFIFAGAVYDNALTNCATLLCCACVDLITCVAERYLTLRTGCEKYGRKNPLPFPFSKRSHIGNLRQTIQGKGRSSKRKGNRRCPFLFAPAAGAATFPPSADGESPAEVQRKTFRPLGANMLTQFAHPGFPVQKRSRPVRANTLTQFACPGQLVQEKEPPRQGEPACGSSRAPVSRCRKKGRTQNLTAKPLQTLFIATR